MVGGVQALGKVRISRGKKVLEVRPAVAWDKGKAIRLLMKRYGKGKQTKLLPVYLGDDLTDEDGFGVIAAYENGISVFVGEASHNTTAQYYLRSPREVTTFLGLLLEHARGASR
jgi:trehalose 6-phosphate phosphatase